ncbi:endolysin [Acinetobacter phage vB_AbaP_APK128]|uniref:Endolysin n=2 Tax=Friunavirus TaxID=1985711 RepID=A0A976SPJ0_9CAUD|nr:endolysin [Acinetobacter phage vB_AbaP_APK128]UVD33036.1 endolysin [Acinetobacter phage vB_Ab4_Hep4]
MHWYDTERLGGRIIPIMILICLLIQGAYCGWFN